MRIFFLLPALLLASFVAIAQPKTKTEPYTRKEYPEITTKTTTVSTDQSLNKVVTIELKDKVGATRYKHTWKKDLEGKWVIEAECLKASGKITLKSLFKIDASGKITRIEGYQGGKLYSSHSRTPDGRLVRTGSENDPESDFEGVKELEELFQKEVKEIEENVLPSLEPKKTACAELGSSCQPQFVVFGGPSVLFGDYGQDKETFIGGHVSFNYNLSSHIGVGIDASLHSKKIGTENLTRSFIMVEGLYAFRDVNNCSQKLTGDIHVLAGLGSEKYGSSNGSGFVFGAGGAVDCKLSKNIGLKLQTDFLGIKFKDTDELNNNIRVSLGAIIKLQRKYNP